MLWKAKAEYLGSKSGGLADTIEATRCWQHREQDSLYKADEEHNGDWFPYTTNGLRYVVNFITILIPE